MSTFSLNISFCDKRSLHISLSHLLHNHMLSDLSALPPCCSHLAGCLSVPSSLHIRSVLTNMPQPMLPGPLILYRVITNELYCCMLQLGRTVSDTVCCLEAVVQMQDSRTLRDHFKCCQNKGKL